jgi:heme-degrading monooxygenase HmoA
MSFYTLGVWTVKPGREDEFVRAWEALGEWTIGRAPQASGTLLRDIDQRNRFVSFGPWRTLEEIEAWRAAPEFQAHVGSIRRLLESFEPGTYELVASIS